MPPSLHAAPVAAPAFSPDPLRCFSQHLRVFWPTSGFLPLPPQSYKLHSHDFRLTPVTCPALIIHAEHAWSQTRAPFANASVSGNYFRQILLMHIGIVFYTRRAP